MKRIVAASYEEMSALAAQIIAEQIKSKPESVLGFATGSTPIGTYDALVKKAAAGALDCTRITTFNLDEYVSLPADHVQSYRRFMQEHLFGGLGLRPEQVRSLCGTAPDPEAECERYEDAIEEADGIDLQLLGIGFDGHIGFNEPAQVFVPATHRTRLDPSTVRANARFFASEDEVPREALTMGIRTIMQAKKLLLIANGAEKRKVLDAALKGDIDPHMQASVLQLHRDLTVIECD